MTYGRARVVVWKASDLAPPERRARRRGATVEPLVVEDVDPDVPLVIGRRRSHRDELKTVEDGGVRLALEQRERPFTSKRHLVVRVRDGWGVHLLPDVRTPAKLRVWGELTWAPATPGLWRPLDACRPLALLLPGTPGYVVSVVAPARSESFAPPPDESTATGAVPPSGAELQRNEAVTVVRSFRTSLQWPPRADDDDDPAWTGAGIRHPEALRMAYRRLYARLRDHLVLEDRLVRGADLTFLRRLIETHALTLEAVVAVAAGCDLDLVIDAAQPPSAPP